MGISTFGSFTQARSAIYASQAGLTVTGNNIANINTTGYTRQKLEQESFRVGGADRYSSTYNLRIGNGVLTTGTSQLRDPYLDIRYRTEMTTVGAMDTKLAGLEDIQAILDEIGDGDDEFGILEAQISELYKALQNMSDQTGHQEYDIQVRSAAQKLVQQLNSYANRLEEVYNNTKADFNQDLETVNGILSSIRDLNASIRKCEIYGDSALELKDQRNLLIDQLAEYVKIDVTYEKEEIGAGVSVDKLVIKLGNANPDASVETDSTTLIDGIYARQFELPDTITVANSANPDYDETQLGNANVEDKYKYPYIDADGNYTDQSVSEVANTNYTLALTSLQDKKGVVMADEVGNVIASADVKLDSKKDGPYGTNGTSTTTKNDNGTVTTERYYEIAGEIPAGDLEITFSVKALSSGDISGTLDASGIDLKKLQALCESNNLTANTDINIEIKDGYLSLVANGATLAKSSNCIAGESSSGSEPFQSLGVYTWDFDDLGSFTMTVDKCSATNHDYQNHRFETLDVMGAFTYEGPQTTYYKETTTATYSSGIILDDNDLYGSLQSTRELLTEEGEFTSQTIIDNVDESAATKRGIPYYQKSLDLLANQLAEVFNDANQGYVFNEDGEYITGTLNDDGTITTTGTISVTYQAHDEKGNPITENNIAKEETYTFKKTDTLESLAGTDALRALKKEAVTTLTQKYKDDGNDAATAAKKAKDEVAGFTSLDDYLNVMGGVSLGEPLFSNRGDSNDTENITASNISISQIWSKGASIVNSFKLPTGMDSIPSTDNDNISNMIYQISAKRDFNPSDVDGDAVEGSMFNGSFQEMWTNMSTVLGNDMSVTTTLLDTAYSSSVSLETSRMGVSSVDLNDEAMNLMQYSQSYNAACRLMTTLDSVLDKLINGTGA